jgi:hypothetical protein
MPAACPSPPRTSFASRGVSLATRGIGACQPDHHTTRRRRGRDRPLSVDGHGLVVGDASAFRTSSTAKTHADVLRVRDTAADAGSAQPHVLPSQLTVDWRARQCPTSNQGQNQSRRPTSRQRQTRRVCGRPITLSRRASYRQRVGPSRSRRPDASVDTRAVTSPLLQSITPSCKISSAIGAQRVCRRRRDVEGADGGKSGKLFLLMSCDTECVATSP